MSSSSPSRPPLALLIWCVLALAGLAYAMAWLGISRTPTPEAGRYNLEQLWPVWIASAAGWAGLTLLWRFLRRHEHCAASSRGAFLRAALLVLAVGVGVRLLVIVMHNPTLSDDVYRFIFDGRNTASGVNPYLVAPQERIAPPAAEEKRHPLTGMRGEVAAPGENSAWRERWAGESVVIGFINNRELHTIYLPVSQWVFALCGLLLPEALDDVATITVVFRGVFVLIETLTMILLVVAMRAMKRSPWWLALYAWHPLPIVEIAGSGHQDVIGFALLVAALVLYTVSPLKIGRWIWALALAALVKPVVIPATAVFLRGRRWIAWVKAAAIAAVICLVVAAPLLLTHDLEPLENLSETAHRFTLKWAHFGSIYEPLLTAIETLAPQWTNDPQEMLARQICLVLLGFVILGVWLRGRDAWRDCSLIFLAMILLSPTAHPWYLLWALVLLPVAPGAAVWIASLTLPWGYAVLGDVVDWTVPAWLFVVAYAPVYVAVVWEVVVLWKGRARAGG